MWGDGDGIQATTLTSLISVLVPAVSVTGTVNWKEVTTYDIVRFLVNVLATSSLPEVKNACLLEAT